MTVFAHVAVGAAVATLAPDPIAAFALGAGSHIPADLIAHRDMRTAWEFGLATLLFAVVALISRFDVTVLVGALGAALPDAEHLLIKLGVWPSRKTFWPTHTAVIRHGGPRPWPNVMAQIAVTVIMLTWVGGAPAFAV